MTLPISYTINPDPHIKVEVCHMEYKDTENKEVTHIRIVNKICGVLDPVIITKERYDELAEIEEKYRSGKSIYDLTDSDDDESSESEKHLFPLKKKSSDSETRKSIYPYDQAK